jgi:hypothetical protein
MDLSLTNQIPSKRVSAHNRRGIRNLHPSMQWPKVCATALLLITFLKLPAYTMTEKLVHFYGQLNQKSEGSFNAQQQLIYLHSG